MRTRSIARLRSKKRLGTICNFGSKREAPICNATATRQNWRTLGKNEPKRAHQRWAAILTAHCATHLEELLRKRVVAQRAQQDRGFVARALQRSVRGRVLRQVAARQIASVAPMQHSASPAARRSARSSKRAYKRRALASTQRGPLCGASEGLRDGRRD